MEESDSLVVDIGKLVEVLLRQRQMIVGITLIFAIIAGIYTMTLPQSFQARALVASIKSASSVSFGSTIETMSEEQLLASGSYGLVDRKARMQSYVQLISSSAVAELVLPSLQQQFPDKDLKTETLLGMVSGDILSGSDSIEITVASSDPELAAAVANAWAVAYVEQVNTIYSEKGAAESYTAIQRQMEDSLEAYQAVQRDLEDFIAQSHMTELERRIEEQQAIVESLSSARNSVLTEAVGDLQNKLANAYQDRRKVDSFLENARNMRDQVEEGGEGAASSNMLALNLLKAQIFGLNDSKELADDKNPPQPQLSQSWIIQTSPITMTAEAMVVDLNGLISTLEVRRIDLDDDIRVLSVHLIDIQSAIGSLYDPTKVLRSADEQEGGLLDLDLFGTPSEQKIQTIEDDLRDLESKLESEQARKAELEQARDLARDAYKNLAIKVAELDVSTGIKSAALTMAAPASIPTGDTTSVVKNTVMAAAIGFALGVLMAYAVEFWWVYKDVEPRPIINLRLGRRNKQEIG